MKNHQEAANFIWSVADEILRGTYTEDKYGDVVLPFVVIRRLDCVLEPTKQAVLDEAKKREGQPNPDGFLRRAAGNLTFYNTFPLTFAQLLNDPPNIGANLRAYIAGFSENTRLVVEKFGLEDQLKKLEENDLLYLTVGKFASVDLHPDTVSNTQMGYIFEELLRRAWSNASAGDHYTPREFIRLMVALLLAEDEDALKVPGTIRTIYDPACGTGGMLFVAEEYLKEEVNERASFQPFGQQLLPETWAIACADMLMRGHDPRNIALGNTLTRDQHAGRTFDYLISNPPFGTKWTKDREFIQRERETQGFAGRFGAGLPRVNDAAMLFLQHMIAKMKPADTGGSRLAIVFNGSPLFVGDAGEGESEIRGWLIQNDWLEAIVALPEDMFFNTNIGTYVWIISNRKSEKRRGLVQLIDAREYYKPMPRSLGQKRKFVSPEQQAEILDLYHRFEDDADVRILPREAFAYQRVTVEYPRHTQSRIPGPQVPDASLRHTERIPIDIDPQRFLADDIWPFEPDAWIDATKTRTGYEFPLSRIFFRYQPPRSVSEIDTDLRAIEARVQALLSSRT